MGDYVRQSGVIEAKHIPVHADNATAVGLPVGSLYHNGDGVLRLVL